MISSAASSNISSYWSCSSFILTFLSSSFRSSRSLRASISFLFLFIPSVIVLTVPLFAFTISRLSRIRDSNVYPSALSLNSTNAYCLSIAVLFYFTASSASASCSPSPSPSAGSSPFSDFSFCSSVAPASSLAFASASCASFIFYCCSF